MPRNTQRIKQLKNSVWVSFKPGNKQRGITAGYYLTTGPATIVVEGEGGSPVFKTVEAAEEYSKSIERTSERLTCPYFRKISNQ